MANWQPFRYAEFWDQPRLIHTTDGQEALLLDCPFDDGLDDYPAQYSVYTVPVRELGTKRDAFPLDPGATWPCRGTVVISHDHLDPTLRESLDWEVLARFRRQPAG
jgi:hypothetical protein